ncbi:MAG TPA: hypothetical protein VFJ57_16055 [Solirubrobacterales bacterium]|nr:hypothetical protein [Solirubrobacterales bacterium]
MIGRRVSVEGSGSEALRELRRVRRRHYVEQIDVMEVLYRIYLALFFGGFGLAIVAGAIHETPVTPEALAWMRDNLAASIGLVVAVGVLVGLRIGSRGGPLAIEAAEVQYVLLAPLDRGRVLRPAALRQLRTGAIAGAVLGVVIGNFVFRRLPGSPVEWIACLAAFGALLPASVLGAALLASGRRLRPLLAGALGLLLVAWSVADLALGVVTSPATMLGELAILPLQSGTEAVLAAPGAIFAVALLVTGLLGVGGILLDAARRRSALTAELRFSASVRDVRAVVLLRRQLASERPRRRPWVRLPAGLPSGHPVWRRGLQSFLRWPVGRVLRALVLGLAAGGIAAGAWSGAPIALVFPGLLLFVAALDFVEPLAQESDHPTRRRLLPVDPGSLISWHMVAPVVALALLILAGAGFAALLAGDPSALGLGLVICAPCALGLVVCATFSATADPYANLLSTPEVQMAMTAAPVGVGALLVAAPLLLAWSAERHGSSGVGAAFSAVFVIAIAAVGAAAFITRRFVKRDFERVSA